MAKQEKSVTEAYHHRYETPRSSNSRSTCNHNCLLQFPFLKERDARFLDALTSEVEVCIFKAGETIMKEGDVGETTHFLVFGTVEVFKDPGCVKVAELGPGNVFGEAALLGVNPRRTATVKALEFCDCRVIHSRVFQKILLRFPIEKSFYQAMAVERMMQNEEKTALKKVVTRTIRASRIIKAMTPGRASIVEIDSESGLSPTPDTRSPTSDHHTFFRPEPAPVACDMMKQENSDSGEEWSPEKEEEAAHKTRSAVEREACSSKKKSGAYPKQLILTPLNSGGIPHTAQKFLPSPIGGSSQISTQRVPKVSPRQQVPQICRPASQRQNRPRTEPATIIGEIRASLQDARPEAPACVERCRPYNLDVLSKTLVTCLSNAARPRFKSEDTSGGTGSMHQGNIFARTASAEEMPTTSKSAQAPDICLLEKALRFRLLDG